MKKIFLLLMILPFFAYSQEKESGCFIEQTTLGANGMIWENDSIKFKVSPSNYFWNVSIENKTNSTAICDWDNTLFICNKKSSGIIFNNTIGLQKNSPKGSENIASGTIITKKIFPVENWKGEDIYPVFKKKYIKKEGDMIIRLIFPVSYGEKKETYELSFRIYL